ncbi:MAG: hypothetical protein EOM16_02330, partial [Bacteroidia bacterium]|nr:hypothetical protein [Bacteroidia bacterium]
MLKKITLLFFWAIIAAQLLNSPANAAQQNEWALSAIHLPDLKLPESNKEVKIALIDTGIYNKGNRLDDTKILEGY